MKLRNEGKEQMKQEEKNKIKIKLCGLMRPKKLLNREFIQPLLRFNNVRFLSGVRINASPFPFPACAKTLQWTNT